MGDNVDYSALKKIELWEGMFATIRAFHAKGYSHGGTHWRNWVFSTTKCDDIRLIDFGTCKHGLSKANNDIYQLIDVLQKLLHWRDAQNVDTQDTAQTLDLAVSNLKKGARRKRHTKLEKYRTKLGKLGQHFLTENKIKTRCDAEVKKLGELVKLMKKT